MTIKTHTICIDGKELVFKMRGDMVDVTLLGDSFGKKKHPLVWLNTEQAALIATVIGTIKKCPPESLIHLENEDENIRIWFDMGLALSYAGWCFPAFNKWCAEQIRDLKRQMDCQEKKDRPQDILMAIYRPGGLPC